MYKVRKGYVMVDKRNRPLTGIVFLQENSPLVQGQEHKLERVSDDEVTGRVGPAVADVTDKDVAAAELRSLSVLPKTELRGLYKKYLGDDAPADATIADIRDALKTHLQEVLDGEASVPADGIEDPPEDDETETAALSERESSPPKKSKK